ncbi:hypothetical protein Intca_0452 [Intrasporangium calvum DSM 43043]|uniref:Uncharacterized protein n=1 Tax=Intrasporangium calvum (strain ATCC 23552 / DSM 43043 / JCM 3097 / NBRC 12989 / NCIMB 10167 / NRRL B-3866 / 7 KIP) TaxID=710696 RepID=E6S8N1_INTC7|nr:hypothetical protein Intca_0452 [Intrasporangium calvum DSM 43043]
MRAGEGRQRHSSFSGRRQRAAAPAGYKENVDTIATFDEVVELARLRAPLYVRHSAGPGPDAEHPALDIEAEVALPGLPASGLTPEPWWTRPDEDWVARRLCSCLDHVEQRGPDSDERLWLLTGVVVGSGPSHEPLIGAVEALGWVGPEALETAAEVYRTRFHGSGLSEPKPA